MNSNTKRRRLAFYGGTFDPVHIGHLSTAEELVEVFELDEFVFVPAFHAPHKPDRKPTSAHHRFAMLCLATQDNEKLAVSTLELDLGEKRYTVDTLAHLKRELPGDEIFFVMGADSWAEIRTWREWEKVLLMTNHIIVTRPGFDIDLTHVTEEIRNRIIDLRNESEPGSVATGLLSEPRASAVGLARKQDESPILTVPAKTHIFITNAVNLDISASRIRRMVRQKATGWQKEVPKEVAKYIEKYQIY